MHLMLTAVVISGWGGIASTNGAERPAAMAAPTSRPPRVMNVARWCGRTTGSGTTRPSGVAPTTPRAERRSRTKQAGVSPELLARYHRSRPIRQSRWSR